MPILTTRDGTQIYYRDWGKGQPVLFSHGWPLTGDAWDPQMMFLRAHGYRVIAHDRRGNGRSDQPDFGNNVDSWADDLADLITHLDLNDIVLVGHSTGGGEVARYIGRHGTSRVAKVVLLDSIVPRMLQAPDNPAGVPIEAIDQIRAGTASNRSQFFQDITTPFFSANRDGSKVTQGMRDLFWYLGLQGSVLAEYETSFSWQLDYTEDARKIDVPTLVIHGDDDQIVPIDAGGRRAAEIIANARLLVYPGGNHGIAITDPDRVNQDLLAFIQEPASAGS
ncbi:alpha/beta fold hydrolase [Sphingomonas sp. GlSt437]|uniref:alpha/beta fold hydrolase n=1 Tax=Sphingomonas sp. GlSt437 TaxID=3389970 RepID=UPI003A873957